ncbi:unnamed protein product, partial [Mesorhabditis spiculigera]
MGALHSIGKGKKSRQWTSCLHFYTGDGEWKPLQEHEIIAYFRDELDAGEEFIVFSEIRKYNVGCWLFGLCGYWHEYTLVKTTNWHWSFEKMEQGIFVQRSKSRDQVRCYFGGKRRKPDRTEGRSSLVSFGENILDVVGWIIDRNELRNAYRSIVSSHHFASLLYEAITRTKENRRLDNTE